MQVFNVYHGTLILSTSSSSNLKESLTNDAINERTIVLSKLAFDELAQLSGIPIQYQILVSAQGDDLSYTSTFGKSSINILNRVGAKDHAVASFNELFLLDNRIMKQETSLPCYEFEITESNLFILLRSYKLFNKHFSRSN